MKSVGVVMLAATLGAGCPGPSTTAAAPDEPTAVTAADAPEGQASEPTHPPLNAVQLDCRSSKNLEIGQVNALFGPSCNKPSMPLALFIFDWGTTSGFFEAEKWASAEDMACFCAQTHCPDDIAMKAIADVKRVMVDERGTAESRGVSQVVDRIAANQCLDATVAGELYKMGFECAFGTGLHSPLIHRERVEFFMKVEHDEARAESRALACEASAPTRQSP